MFVRRTAATLVGAALLLAGCSEDPEPRFDPPSPSPSPSASASSAEPEAQTPEEFIREWVELQRDMQNTGETTQFREASGSREACTELADLIDEYYESGGFVRTDGWTVRSLERLNAPSGQVSFEAQIRSASTQLKKSASSETQTIPAGEGTERFVIKEVDGRWQMIEIAEVAN